VNTICKVKLAVLIASGGLYCQPAMAADEIVITAERRAQAQNDVAFSISKINHDQLITIQAEHPAEVLNQIPGTSLHRGSGQEHLTAIRSPILTGGAGAGSFLFLENGVPVRAAGFANVNGLLEAQTALADNFEVVRGPGGAFYGANAIHGVINVQTPTPKQTGYQGTVSVSERIQQANASLTHVADGKGFYAGIALQNDQGFRDDSGADKQQLTLRHVDETGRWNRDVIFSFTNLNQETAGFLIGEDAFADETLATTNPNPNAFRDVRSARLQSNFSRTSQTGTLTITPYARWTDMTFRQHFLPSQAIERNSHWSVGAQSAWHGKLAGTGTYALGLDAEYTQGFLTEVQENPTIFSFIQGVHYDYQVTASSLSPFANAVFELGANTSLTIAARGDWTHYDYETRIAANLPSDPGRFLRPSDRSDTFFTLSPKISLQRKFANGTGWIGYAQGARPPQTTDLYRLQDNQLVGDIEPETIDNLEAGWRGSLGVITGEITGYFSTKENFLFRDADGFNVTNGRTRHIGIEAAFTWAITPSLSLAMNGTYARHTYRFDRPVNSAINATEAIRFGDDIDTAPRTLGGARLNWTPTPERLVQVGWVHVGRYFTDAANQNTYDGHDIFDLRTEQGFGGFTGFVHVRNLLDTAYAERADFAFGNARSFPSAGRNITIGLRFQY